MGVTLPVDSEATKTFLLARALMPDYARKLATTWPPWSPYLVTGGTAHGAVVIVLGYMRHGINCEVVDDSYAPHVWNGMSLLIEGCDLQDYSDWIT